MLVPISWLKDYVDITVSIEELSHKLTMAGLEVEEIRYVGLPIPEGKIEGRAGGHMRPETKLSGIEWSPSDIVVAAVLEVMPHPNADRLVLCRLDDGERENIVLTGAPNLYPYKGKGPLEKALKVTYAKEGAHIFDGHKPGQVLTKLKRAKIRGVESYSMICSEKELGISDDHEGVIILDDDAPVGVPLVEYMGDAVFDIAITPNIARNANMLGVAREVAALTNKKLREPSYEFVAEGQPIKGEVSIDITDPELNPRFVLGLIRDVKTMPSPYWVQRRLHLAGMRPIDAVVDATNYVMLEVGQPLHAFDYDVLVERAGGKSPTIITRQAQIDEQITTLDGVDRTMDDFTIMVCDTVGSLGIAGVMGGAESEVNAETRDVLLEGASWNFINVRRTVNAQNLPSEAAYRFSRGVHPALASHGVSRCLELMRQWSGGVVDNGLVDIYPLVPEDPTVEITTDDVKRWLGIDLTVEEIAKILRRLGFVIKVDGQAIRATSPDHRLDISEGITGVADLMEEIARIYGYERIPESSMADPLPPQRNNPSLEREERIRDLLVELSLQEVVNYRLTSPAREERLLPADKEVEKGRYVRLANPIASDRDVLRQELLSSVLENVERNVRIRERIALFEMGPVFQTSDRGELPEETSRLAIVMAGPRTLPDWQEEEPSSMDFYDIKGLLTEFFNGLRLGKVQLVPEEHPTFHPGKCASINIGEKPVGVMGELHPLVRERFDLPETPILAADLDLDLIKESLSDHHTVLPVPAYPPILEDLAVIVEESVPAERVREVIWTAGGKMLVGVRLFDLYHGDQIGTGKKSLAYSLAYQAPDRTLTDKEAVKIRQRIIRGLEADLGAKLRS